ncbi:uncharacterized protein LOC126765698 [Bactrocera neohumeralis]|uniref:uncharacterized protein LOC126765698 n=1 Tax=Bactrocera neohumeralis TaxID=98809 RepID=UPI0021654A70|nr:uncharacterized protein LOC126765698 [Bactrocera neohumeralis]
MFGVMDDDDRQDILNHLKIIEENGHNAIVNLNKQIVINEHLNRSLNLLKGTIESDRKQIIETLNIINKEENRIESKILYNDEMNKLKFIESKVQEIQNNIAAAKYNMVHPSMLTREEIEKYEIDFYKLKLSKVGVVVYRNDTIIFAIQIPRTFFQTKIQLITPMPNRNKLQIIEKEKFVIKIGENYFDYVENKAFKNLKLSKSCIFSNTCEFKYNNKTSIQEISDDTILIRNAKNDVIKQNCDDRKIVLKNNYIIKFVNCKMEILKQEFKNNKTEYIHTIIYPAEKLNQSYTPKLTFNDIAIKNIENIKEIAELKYHKNVSYGINISLIIIVMVVVAILVIILKKKTTKIKIVNTRTQESSNSNAGGVASSNDSTTVKLVDTQKKTSIF